MLKTIAVTKFISGADSGHVILGANEKLSLTHGHGAGWSHWYLDQTPKPDHMHVNSWHASIMDAAGKYIYGGHLWLGHLTGIERAAVAWIHAGVIGQDGSWMLRAPREFQTDYGLVVWMPGGFSLADWWLETVVTYD